MSKILVTGSDGRFGRIIKKFNNKGFIFRNKKELNILSENSIEKNLKRYKPKAILHLAGLSRPMKIHEKNISKSINLDKEFNNFQKYVLKKRKWKKWNYNNENNLIKFLSAAHYHFNSKIYKDLLKKINLKVNFQKKLDNIIENNLLRFY